MEAVNLQMHGISMFVGVLPEQTRVVKIAKTRLKEAAAAILQLCFFRPPERFFSFTETKHDISVIVSCLDLQTLAQIPETIVSPFLWRVLRLSEGEQVGVSVVVSVSKALASDGFSILYSSTSTGDYVLVQEKELDAVLCCLEKKLSVVVEHLPGDAHNHDDCQQCSLASNADEENELKPSIDLADTREQQCSSLSIDDELRSLCIAIVHLVLEAPRPVSLFSLSIIDADISMVLDKCMADILQAYVPAVLTQPWAVLKVLGDWGFTETGLVYNLSRPIEDSGISAFYLSTFNTDYMLLESEKAPLATECLNSRGIEVLHFDGKSDVTEYFDSAV